MVHCSECSFASSGHGRGLLLPGKAYLPKLYAGQRPLDLDQHRSEIVASLHKPGHAKAFSLTAQTSHQQAESRLGEVAMPVLVVMGEQDPDFPDHKAEAEWTRPGAPSAGRDGRGRRPLPAIATTCRCHEPCRVDGRCRR